MPFPLVPVAIGLLGTGAYIAQSRRNPGPVSEKVRQERLIIYDTLINHEKNPDILRRFSDAFRAEGCLTEADMLAKRAALREQTPEQKQARHEAFKKGMSSKDPGAIRQLASAFEDIGATGAAASLRDHASALERAKEEGIINEPSIMEPEPSNASIDQPETQS